MYFELLDFVFREDAPGLDEIKYRIHKNVQRSYSKEIFDQKNTHHQHYQWTEETSLQLNITLILCMNIILLSNN